MTHTPQVHRDVSQQSTGQAADEGGDCMGSSCSGQGQTAQRDSRDGGTGETELVVSGTHEGHPAPVTKHRMDIWP